MESRVAARLPRRGDPGRRRLPRVRHRPPVVPDHPHRAGGDQGLPQRLPPPGTEAPGEPGPRRSEHPMRVPRLVLGARRLDQGDPLPVGLPRRRRRRRRPPRSQGREVARVRVHQPRPQRRPARRLPRRPRRALRPRAVRAAVQGGARAQADADELEDLPGSVHGELPRGRHPPDADGDPRRRQQPLRRVRQLQPGDVGRRGGEPAPHRHAPLGAATRRAASTAAGGIR